MGGLGQWVLILSPISAVKRRQWEWRMKSIHIVLVILRTSTVIEVPASLISRSTKVVRIRACGVLVVLTCYIGQYASVVVRSPWVVFLTQVGRMSSRGMGLPLRCMIRRLVYASHLAGNNRDLRWGLAIALEYAMAIIFRISGPFWKLRACTSVSRYGLEALRQGDNRHLLA